jgi:hypothetical protein
MSRILHALKNDGHVLNWVLLTLGVTAPACAYYAYRAPPAAEVEARVRASFPEAAARAASQEGHLTALWARRNSMQMDALYASLLRAGASSRKRHYAITGPLSDVTAEQDAAYAEERRALGLAPPPAGARGGGVEATSVPSPRVE